MNRDFEIQIPKKACSKCCLVKPLYEFQMSKKTIDGVIGRCMECAKASKKPTELDILRRALPNNHSRWNMINR